MPMVPAGRTRIEITVRRTTLQQFLYAVLSRSLLITTLLITVVLSLVLMQMR